MKDRDSKIVSSFIVEAKSQGTSEPNRRIADNMFRFGYKQVIFKSDQEPALVDLTNWIIEFRDEHIIPEPSPPPWGSHRATDLSNAPYAHARTRSAPSKWPWREGSTAKSRQTTPQWPGLSNMLERPSRNPSSARITRPLKNV